MSDDPTREMPRPDRPVHGSVGPTNPHADPATDPGLRVADVSTVPPASTPDPALAHTRSGGLWTGLILSAIVGIFLLVFILQNLDPVQITFLVFTGTLPIGVALLLAAIAGLLLVAIPGGLRIAGLRRAARRAAKR